MKKLLAVLFILLLAGCSTKNVDSDLIGFQLVDDTLVENEDGSYSGRQAFEGQDVFSGKLLYPSAIEGAWYFEPDEESLERAPKYDMYEEVGYYALVIPGNESLNEFIPEEALGSDCKYGYDVEVEIDGIAFNFTGFHIYNEIGGFELESISDDYQEICD